MVSFRTGPRQVDTVTVGRRIYLHLHFSLDGALEEVKSAPVSNTKVVVKEEAALAEAKNNDRHFTLLRNEIRDSVEAVAV